MRIWSSPPDRFRSLLAGSLVFAVCSGISIAQAGNSRNTSTIQTPSYRVDPAWPKPLPNHWTLGPVCGVAVDSHRNVWIVQRPIELPPTPVTKESSSTVRPAPPVLEFNPQGALIASWGGPGDTHDWPREVHGIYVDRHDNVWVGGASKDDNQVLKFTSKGRFLLQIGHPGANKGSNDPANLGGPADLVVDESANELYVADGYINHRVVVFNAATGAHKRHWGAYGKPPDDSYYTRLGIKPGEHPNNNSKKVPTGLPLPQFDLVHSVRLSRDGLVYVCDRSNNRIQVFHKNGTFIQEAFIANDVLASGSTSDVGFSADPRQRFAFVADSTNQHVYVLDRANLKVLGSFGDPGSLPGQFQGAHNMAVDARGDVFVTESRGMRVQKFVPAR